MCETWVSANSCGGRGSVCERVGSVEGGPQILKKEEQKEGHFKNEHFGEFFLYIYIYIDTHMREIRCGTCTNTPGEIKWTGGGAAT